MFVVMIKYTAVDSHAILKWEKTTICFCTQICRPIWIDRPDDLRNRLFSTKKYIFWRDKQILNENINKKINKNMKILKWMSPSVHRLKQELKDVVHVLLQFNWHAYRCMHAKCTKKKNGIHQPRRHCDATSIFQCCVVV